MALRIGPKGFTLVELAIVLTISGLLLTSFLSLFHIIEEKRKVELTKTRMAEIKSLLTMYAAKNDRLPCPASPETLRGITGGPDLCRRDPVTPTNIEIAYTGSGPGSVMAEDQSMQVWIGLVPVRDLRLNSEEALDGWGNPFTYAVSRVLTWPGGMIGNPAPLGHISVVDGNGNSLIERPDSARYVIISHGPANDGGWSPQGYRNQCRRGTLAAENCRLNGRFVVAPYARAPGPSYFDHFVIHDGLDAGGNLADRLAKCGGRRAFFIPDDPAADKDGCVVDATVWHGACIQNTLFNRGSPLPQPAVALMPPAQVSGETCGCAPGYKDAKLKAWTTINGVVSMQADAVGLTLTADKSSGKVTGNVIWPSGPLASSELHTCIQQPAPLQ